MNPVLVIGGCGGLGHHIVKQLLEDGDATDITVFDKSLDRNHVQGAKYIKGDLGSEDDVSNVFQAVKPQVVFHTASPMLIGPKNPNSLFEKTNIEGTHNLLNAINKTGFVKVLVYIGTSSVIHNNITDVVNATEDLPKCYLPEQTEYYTHTKAVAEDLVLGANRKDGLLTVALRGTTLFGEGDNTTIPQMVNNAKSHRSKMQVRDGKNLFDCTYLGNAAHAHLLAARILIKTPVSSPPPPDDQRIDGEAFVITNDEPWPFFDFIRAVAAAAGHPVAKDDVRVVPSWLFYIIAILAEWGVWMSSFGRRESQINRKMVRYLGMTRTFDISKAKTRLGYRPRIGIQDAIQRSVDDYLSTCATDAEKKAN